MEQIRPPAVAGMFYPDDPDELRAQIQAYLRQSSPRQAADDLRALIVPHAGYIYSGPVAASAYRLLEPLRERIHRVALFGPAHRVAFRGLALSSATHFLTPLGKIPLARDTQHRLLAHPQVQVIDQAHAQEHSLEVQLPFLQMLLDDFSLIPVVVGETRAETVAEVMEDLWDEPGLLLVVSSDLSHYHDYQTARHMDSATSQAIEALQPEHIGYDQACGRTPLNGLLLLARRHGLRAVTLDQRNSGDTAGPPDRVVGYGAYALLAQQAA